MRLRTIPSLLLLLALVVTAGCATKPATTDAPSLTAASADGSPIAYGSRGEGGPALVFIHCWTCNHGFWRNQIDHFAKKQQVIWLDLAGHGRSGSRRTEYTIESFGEDVAAVVERAGARKVVLIGHSMGGPVAVEAAKRLGDRVVGIVGVDVFHTGFVYPTDPAKVKGFVAPFEKAFHAASEGMVRTMFTPAADPREVEAIVAQFKDADPAMGISAMYALFDWQGHRAPGELERFAPILRNINGAPNGDERPAHPSVTLIPGVGHFPAQIKPEAFNRELERIVAGF